MLYDVDMTMQELTELEDYEYEESTRALLEKPEFRKFLIRWLVETKIPYHSPVSPEQLPRHNWLLAQESLMTEFMEGLRLLAPAEHLTIIQEVNEYECRRQRASDQFDRNDAERTGSDD